MSGSLFWPRSSPTGEQAEVTVDRSRPSPLWALVERTTPGYEPDYEDCKIVYVYHPLGARIVDAPIYLAFHRPRVISIEDGPKEELTEAFEKEWTALGEQGATRWIIQAVRLAAIYGISAVGVGVPGVPTDRPLTDDEWLSPDLYFQIFDPLNTAGSLTLSQNPQSPDFLKPRHFIVDNQVYHLSRGVVLQNEDPIYIQWTSAAFGFTGRSKYIRAMYPLASYVRMMVANNMVAQKLGLLIAKLKPQGSIVDRVVEALWARKLQKFKSGSTYNTISIDIEEAIETLNMMNVDGAGKFARNNIIQDIASAAAMPALLISQDTLAEGFADGSEDAKTIASYIEAYRAQQEPLFRFFDRIVQRRAWSPDFYRAMKRKYPSVIGNRSYAECFQEWCDGFKAQWPSLVQQSDKDELEGQQRRFDSVVKLLEVMGAMTADPESRAQLISWAADNINAQDKMFAAPLLIDPELAATMPPAPEPQEDEPPATEDEAA